MALSIGGGITIGGGISVAPSVAPVITINSPPFDYATYVGDTATFSVTASVTQGATLSYQWQLLPSGSGTWSNILGATSSSYTTGTLSSSDNGNSYRVVVSATGGATPVTSNGAGLTVVSATITINSQPTGQTASSGSTATFSVTASADYGATLSYQWYLQAGGSGSFNAISMATSSSYTTPTLSSGDNNNNYYVIVSADRGATPVTSNTVTLTVGGGSVGNGPFVAGVDYSLSPNPGLSVGGPPGGPYNMTIFDSAWTNTGARDAIYAKAVGTAFTCIIGGVTVTVTTTSSWTSFGPGQYASVTCSSAPSGQTTSITFPSTVTIINGQWTDTGSLALPVSATDTAGISAMDALGSNKTITITDALGSATITISGSLTKQGPFGGNYFYQGNATTTNPGWAFRFGPAGNPIISATL